MKSVAISGSNANKPAMFQKSTHTSNKKLAIAMVVMAVALTILGGVVLSGIFVPAIPVISIVGSCIGKVGAGIILASSASFMLFAIALVISSKKTSKPISTPPTSPPPTSASRQTTPISTSKTTQSPQKEQKAIPISGANTNRTDTGGNSPAGGNIDSLNVSHKKGRD